MNEKDRDLMERYIFEVTRRVPSAQRDEIKLELTELIEDMYEAQNADMEAVLTKLGDPGEFAKKYRDETNYVISPEYYDNYLWILKIVLACVAGSGVLSWIVSLIIDPLREGNHYWGLNGDLLGALVTAFGMVTLIFAVMERLKVKVNLKNNEAWRVENLSSDNLRPKNRWTPGQLSPVPHKKGLISRAESIVGIVFLAIFGVLLIAVPQLFGAYVMEDGELVRTISIFNLEKWSMIFPVLLISFLVCFIDEVVKLVMGCYCTVVMVSNIICGVFQIILAAIALKLLPIWNPDFVTDLTVTFDKSITSKGDILFYWSSDLISNGVLAFICVVTLLEIANTIYKTIRYGVKTIKNY